MIKAGQLLNCPHTRPQIETVDQTSAPPNRPSYARPLAGVRVLDLSQGIAGPYCGMLLALYGADVVKLEPPQGDWGRSLGHRVGDHTAIDLTANRGKRSIAVDLKPAAGKALLARLAERCDVFIENFRPGVAARLGAGYAAVREKNPKVIYLSVSAFGQQGPRRESPGSDTVAQAFSGMMSVNRDPAGVPKATGFLTADYVTALYAFQAVSMALAARPYEAEGRHLDVSLAHASAAFLAMKVIEARLEGDAPRKLNAPAGSYRTRDGWIAVTLTKESHFASLCRTIGRDDLTAEPRYRDFALRARNQQTLVPLIQAALLERSTEEWLRDLQAADVLCSPIHSVSRWLEDPQTRATGVVAEETLRGMPPIPWVRIPGAVHPGPGDARSRWPDIGEHGREILREVLMLGEAEIDALIAQGVVLAGAPGNRATR